MNINFNNYLVFKLIMKKLFLIFFCISIGRSAFSQTEVPTTVLQPSIMVIPFAKEGQHIRTVFEAENAGPIRVAITKVKEKLEAQHIKTIDFRAYDKQLHNQAQMRGNQQVSVKQKIIELSAADIYIETEVQIIETPRGNSATVILTAFDAFTGASLVNKLGNSPKFYTQNFEKLTIKALDTFLDKFTISLEEVFQDMIQNGRTIAVDIGIDENSSIDMDSSLGEENLLLAELIENWFEKNAYHSYFHIQGITATKMIFDEVKIPTLDPVTNKNYYPTKFITPLRKYLKGLGLEVTRDIQGTKVFITISSNQ